jgi:methyl-accepting chemotaxis protein
MAVAGSAPRKAAPASIAAPARVRKPVAQPALAGDGDWQEF